MGTCRWGAGGIGWARSWLGNHPEDSDLLCPWTHTELHGRMETAVGGPGAVDGPRPGPRVCQSPP